MPRPATIEHETPGLFGFLQRLIRANHYEVTRERQGKKITNMILGPAAWGALARDMPLHDMQFNRHRRTDNPTTEIEGVCIEPENTLAPHSLAAVHKDRDGMHSILLNIVDTRLSYDPEAKAKIEPPSTGRSPSRSAYPRSPVWEP